MGEMRRAARINVKAVVILVVMVVGLAGGLFGAHHIRKRVRANNALTEAKQFLAEERWADACGPLRVYLRQYPDDVDILVTYAEASLAVRPRELENANAAANAYRRLLRHRPGNDAISEVLGKLYLIVGKVEDALHIAEQRLQVDENDVDAVLAKARILIARTMYEEARPLLEKAAAARLPDAAEVFVLLAEISVLDRESSGGAVEAIEWLNTGVAEYPDSAELGVGRAMYYVGAMNTPTDADFEAARAELLRVEALQPTHPNLLLRIARGWIALGDFERSGRLISRLEKIEDDALVDNFVQPRIFRFEWFRVAALHYRGVRDMEALSRVARKALQDFDAENHKFQRSRILPMAVNMLAESGHPEEARSALDEYSVIVEEAMRGRDAGNADLALLEASVALAEDRPFEIIAILKPIVDLAPENTSAWRLLAEGYSRTQQNDLAVDALRRAAVGKPSDVGVAMNLLREYMNRRDWASAKRAAEDCARLTPDNSDIRLMRIEAELRYELGRPVKSDVLPRLKQEIESVVAEQPKSAQPRMLQALMAERTEGAVEAEQIVRTVVAECDDTMQAYVYLGRLLEIQGKSEEAESVARQATTVHGDVADAWVWLARVLESKSDFEGARDALSAGIESVSDDFERFRMRRILARLRVTRLDRKGGIEDLKSLAAEDPNDADTLWTLLDLPEIMEDRALSRSYVDSLRKIEGESGLSWRYHEARWLLAGDDWRDNAEEIDRLFAECVEGGSGWWTQAILRRAVLHRLLGDSDRAERVYREALARSPRETQIVDRLAALLSGQRRFAEAKVVLEQLARRFPDRKLPKMLNDEVLRVHLGLAETAANDSEAKLHYTKAADLLSVVIASEPNNPASRVLMARVIYQRDGDADRALKMLDAADALGDTGLASVAARIVILRKEGRTEEVEQLLSGIVAERGDFDSYLLRAEYLSQVGEAERAEQDYVRLSQFEESAVLGHQLLGRFYFRQGRADDAIVAWRAGLSYDPANLTTRGLLMGALVAKGSEEDREEGLRMLDELLEVNPRNPEYIRIRAMVAIEKGTPESIAAAERDLREVLRINPKSVRVAATLISVYASENDFDRAAGVIARSLDANPDSATLMTMGARIEDARGNRQMAEDFARSAVRMDPQNVGALKFLYDSAVRANDLAEAGRIVRKLSALKPDDWSVRVRQADLLRQEGRNEEALAVMAPFDEIPTGEGAVPIAIAMAELNCAVGRDDKFESRMAELERLAVDVATLMQIRCRCLAGRARYAELVSLLKEHRANYPDDSTTPALGAAMLNATGDPAWQREAALLFKDVAQKAPESLAAQLAAAQASYVAGELEYAISTYREVLAIDDTNRQALNDLAWILGESGDDDHLEEGVRLAEQGVRLYPRFSHIRDTRAVLYMKRGGADDLTSAVNDLRVAIELSKEPDNPITRARAYVNLGDVYVRLGQIKSAREALAEARTLGEASGAFGDDDMARLTELEAQCE